MTAQLDLVDGHAERGAVGCALVTGNPDPQLREGLEAAHFHDLRLRDVWRAISRLHADGEPVDPVTVHDALAPGSSVSLADLHALSGEAASIASAGRYARIVVEHHRWRTVRRTIAAADAAAARRDEQEWATALGALLAADARQHDVADASPRAVAHSTLDRLERGPLGRTSPWPALDRSTRGTLLQPGDVTIVGAWTSTGKSCVVLQWLAHHARSGASTRIYANEMSAEDYTERWLAAETGVPYDRFVSRELRATDWPKVTAAAPGFPVAVQSCPDWSAHQVALDVRRHRPDVWALDLFDLLPMDGRNPVAERDEASRALNAAARATGTHGLVVCQLNQERAKSATLPAPVLRDLRGTGRLATDATAVVFVHRDETVEDGRTVRGMDGAVFVAKNRKGPLGSAQVRFDPGRQVFAEPVDGTVVRWSA